MYTRASVVYSFGFRVEVNVQQDELFDIAHSSNFNSFLFVFNFAAEYC